MSKRILIDIEESDWEAILSAAGGDDGLEETIGPVSFKIVNPMVLIDIGPGVEVCSNIPLGVWTVDSESDNPQDELDRFDYMPLNVDTLVNEEEFYATVASYKQDFEDEVSRIPKEEE